jgi:hypothetical protein
VTENSNLLLFAALLFFLVFVFITANRVDLRTKVFPGLFIRVLFLACTFLGRSLILCRFLCRSTFGFRFLYLLFTIVIFLFLRIQHLSAIHPTKRKTKNPNLGLPRSLLWRFVFILCLLSSRLLRCNSRGGFTRAFVVLGNGPIVPGALHLVLVSILQAVETLNLARLRVRLFELCEKIVGDAAKMLICTAKIVKTTVYSHMLDQRTRICYHESRFRDPF